MKTVTLPGVTLPLPVLGFGCSSLMGHQSAQERMAVLETAFDSGIRHFDVARYYGFGEAEGALGDFIQTRRDQVTVTTKFGISPPAQSSALRSLLGVARRVAAQSPFLRRSMTGAAGKMKMVKSGNFSVDAAQHSLETSLRQLKTEYIDFYLLHDCGVEDTTDELLHFLQSSVQQGKIRHFGVGTSLEVAAALCGSRPEFTRVTQFENSVLRNNLSALPAPETRIVITHRALSESLETLWQLFASNADAARRWSQQMGADCTDRAVLSQLMLLYAVQANSHGLVLFSTRSQSRIRENVHTLEAPPFSPEQITQFAAIAQEHDLRLQ